MIISISGKCININYNILIIPKFDDCFDNGLQNINIPIYLNDIP